MKTINREFTESPTAPKNINHRGTKLGRPRGARDRHGRAVRVDCPVLRRSGWPVFCRAFGQRLEDEMRRAEVAASELAAAIDVHPMTVHAWRRGRSVPAAFMIAAVATALRCSFVDLLPDQAHDIGGV